MDAKDRKAILMEQLGKALEKVNQQRAAVAMKPPLELERPVEVKKTMPKPPPFSPPPPVPEPPQPNVVTIDEAHLEKHRILAHRPRCREADVFRILRTQILQIMSKSGFRTLAITSPNYGDGKTTIALNLAMSIALDTKQTVLVVDLDLRKPNLYEYMGIKPTIGLSNYLLHGTPLRECLVRPPFDRLNTLPAGPAIEYSSEILGSPKMAMLAHELKTRYTDRMIIYDMPPVLAQDDSNAFMPHVDAVLMVVRDGITRTDEIRMCLDKLVNANLIGVVLNDARDTIDLRPQVRRRAE